MNETNRHPVDRMAALKAEIAALQSEFNELRAQVISGEVDAAGDEWIADVQDYTTRRIAVADAERVLPAGTLEQIVRLQTLKVVRLRPRPRAAMRRFATTQTNGPNEQARPVSAKQGAGLRMKNRTALGRAAPTSQPERTQHAVAHAPGQEPRQPGQGRSSLEDRCRLAQTL